MTKSVLKIDYIARVRSFLQSTLGTSCDSDGRPLEAYREVWHHAVERNLVGDAEDSKDISMGWLLQAVA